MKKLYEAYEVLGNLSNTVEFGSEEFEIIAEAYHKISNLIVRRGGADPREM